MTADEYWFGDPHLIYRYAKVFENKQKLEEQRLWLMGAYMRLALMSSALNVNGFIQKSSQVLQYPDCPHTDLGQKAKPFTPEQQLLIAKARAQLIARGVLRET